jgi:hypothetical protein
MTAVQKTVGQPVRQTWPGVYMGIVTSTSDPLSESRIKMKVPQVTGTAISNWAEPLGLGNAGVPSPGTIVHAMFMGGDINRPVYMSLSSLQEQITSIQSAITALQSGNFSSVTAGTIDVTSDLKIPAGAGTGYLATSDSSGNLSWSDTIPSAISTIESDITSIEASIPDIIVPQSGISSPGINSAPAAGSASGDFTGGALSYITAFASTYNTTLSYVNTLGDAVIAIIDALGEAGIIS